MREFDHLPARERVFVKSLLYHGFRFSKRRCNLKYTIGFIVPSTGKEDAGGIDFWVKMPRDDRLLPVQVTQRGVRLYKIFQSPTLPKLEDFISLSNERIRKKQQRCKRHGIAFVLVRDFAGSETNRTIAWGDWKALRYAIAHLRRWL